MENCLAIIFWKANIFKQPKFIENKWGKNNSKVKEGERQDSLTDDSIQNIKDIRSSKTKNSERRSSKRLRTVKQPNYGGTRFSWWINKIILL